MRRLRKWHAYVSAIIALPCLITFITGSFLIMRSHLSFMQPAKTDKQVYLLENVASMSAVVKKAKLFYGEDVEFSSINFYPSKGYYSVRTNERRELRLHAENLETLIEGPKNTGFFIKLHEGSFFSPLVRDFIFFPSVLSLIFLLISGIIIFSKTKYRRRKHV